MIREGIATQYRDPFYADETPFVAPQESTRAASRRGAYAAAIATHSTWQSRLDAAPAAGSTPARVGIAV
jgi:hypothetical protein